MYPHRREIIRDLIELDEPLHRPTRAEHQAACRRLTPHTRHIEIEVPHAVEHGKLRDKPSEPLLEQQLQPLQPVLKVEVGCRKLGGGFVQLLLEERLHRVHPATNMPVGCHHLALDRPLLTELKLLERFDEQHFHFTVPHSDRALSSCKSSS